MEAGGGKRRERRGEVGAARGRRSSLAARGLPRAAADCLFQRLSLAEEAFLVGLHERREFGPIGVSKGAGLLALQQGAQTEILFGRELGAVRACTAASSSEASNGGCPIRGEGWQGEREEVAENVGDLAVRELRQTEGARVDVVG